MAGYKTADIIAAIETIVVNNERIVAEEFAVWQRDELPKWKYLRDHITSQARKGRPIDTESLATVLGKDRYGSSFVMPKTFNPPAKVALLDYSPSLRRTSHGYRNIYIEDVSAVRLALLAWQDDEITDRQLQTMGFKQMIAAVFTAAANIREGHTIE